MQAFTEGAETTAVWSIIQYYDVPADLRIEPEYYQPRYLKLQGVLEELESCSLESLAHTVNSGPFGSNLLKTTYVDDGVVVLRPFNIKDATVENENLVFIPLADCEAQGLNLYASGDLAFARVGDIRCGVIPDFGKPITISPNIIVAKLDRDKINPYYAAVFMNTKLGFSQLQRALKVVAQPTITVETIKSLTIPIIPKVQQLEIERLLKASFQERLHSQTLYTQAETLLMTELGLDTLDLTPQRTYVQTASQAWTANRLDAEYFQPKYARVEYAIRHGMFPSASLEALIESITNGYDYRDYTETGTPYIRVGDVFNGRINLADAVKIPITIADVNKAIDLRVGDVLFTRKGTFGNAAVVREGQEHAIISSEIMLLRLRVPTILPDYLALFLNSQAGYLQVERRVHGVAYYSISQPDLADLNIPIPSLNIQQHLTQLVRQSIDAEREATYLLEEAKARVETFILGTEA